MSTISGHVYYMPGNVFTPGTGIQNVPIVLFDSVNLTGAVALTNAAGTFTFTNVPSGTYQVIEAWGAPGGTASPVDFAIASVPMPVAPAEAEPPLSALPVAPPAGADLLQARTPNLLFVPVAGADVTNLVFYDGPVGNRSLNFSGVNMVGPNLITAADSGTWGSYPPGTAGSTMEPVSPYPGISPGFTYVVDSSPNDGQFTVINTNVDVTGPLSPWWGTSDHDTRLETGRYILVNGDNPGAAFFTQQVTVTPNTDYILSAWVMNLIVFQSGYENPQLGLQVQDQNGNVLVSQDVNAIPPQLLPVWFENGFLFNSGGNSSLTVQVVSRGLLAQGNDYVVDDISLHQAEFVNLLDTQKSIQPPIVYSKTGVGESVTITVNVSNPTAQTINNVFFQDALNPLLLFTPGSVLVNGSNLGYETADPNLGFTLGNLASGMGKTITFTATTTGGPATVPNTAQVSYDAIVSGNGDIIRATFPTNTAEVEIRVSTANLTTTKSVDKAYAQPGDVLTYTLSVQNTGSVTANHVVLTDVVPVGTTFVSGSVTGAVGTPPTLTLANPIAAGGIAVVTFKVKVNGIPTVNPISNLASTAYTYTVDPAVPNGEAGAEQSNTVTTQVSVAMLTATKTVDKSVAYLGDVVTYQLAVQNTGNVPADNVVVTDLLPAGLVYLAGSLTVSVPYSGTIATGISLSGAIAPSQTVAISFKATIASIPNPNPALNQANVNYTYTVDPENPNGTTGITITNKVQTTVFRNNYGRQINDIIGSVAKEQAALAALVNAEGAKVQRLAATHNVTSAQLMCLNQSVSEMMDSLTMLESVLKQKLTIVDCQIDGCRM